MSKAAHTPTPWQVSKIPFEVMTTDSAAAIYGPYEIQGGACFIADISRSPGDHQASANADLIITAVNHHQELVTRLYNLVNAVETADKDGRTAGSVALRIEEARETLKKVIQ